MKMVGFTMDYKYLKISLIRQKIEYYIEKEEQ